MSTSYVAPVAELSAMDNYFRRIFHTSPSGQFQLVSMTLQPGENIGGEVHDSAVQYVYIVSGSATVVLDDKTMGAAEGFGIVIEPGTYHDIVNTSSTDALHMLVVYTPALHKANKAVRPGKRRTATQRTVQQQQQQSVNVTNAARQTTRAFSFDEPPSWYVPPHMVDGRYGVARQEQPVFSFNTNAPPPVSMDVNERPAFSFQSPPSWYIAPSQGTQRK